MKKISFLFLIVLSMGGSVSYGQHISQAMQFNSPPEAKDSNTISLNYSNLFYFRDYEYFNQIQTGYTLFGSWHYPRIAIQPNKWFRIEAGMLLQKNSGDNQLDKARPMFSFQAHPGNFQFIFGALESNESHDMPDPILGYDKIIDRPIEEGFQVKYKTKKIKTDVWLDWELRQKINSNFPEELTGGLSFSYLLTNPDKPLRISVPVSVLIPHKGGQLDTNGSVVITVINRSVGLAAEWNSRKVENWLQQTKFDLNFLGYNLFQDRTSYPYQNGSGFLVNYYIRSKWCLAFLASYWNGKKFIAPKGGSLYQSISSISGRTYNEPNRELIFLNLMYEKELFPGLFIDCRYSPYIDLRNNFFEHSFLVLLSYRNLFNLGKLKK